MAKFTAKLTAKERKAGVDLRDVLRDVIGPRVTRRVDRKPAPRIVIPHNPLSGPPVAGFRYVVSVNVPPAKPLRVWWIPQVPMKAFHADVQTVAEAMLLLDVLARYDLFQFENNIKPDYANAGGLEEFTDGEWFEWSDENGEQIDDLRRQARGA